MGKSALLKDLESEYIKQDVCEFSVGDTISVHLKIVEGNKQRIQVFTGTVIARQGSGASETVTLHRVAYGLGMERLFLINNPQVVKIERIRLGKVRRAKLNYLKGKTGKQAKVQEKITAKKSKTKVVETKAKPEAKQAEAKEANSEGDKA